MEKPSLKIDPARRGLWLVFVISAACCLAILWFSFRFRYGEDFAERPILEVVGLFGILTICYLWALFLVLKRGRTASASTADDGKLLGLIVLGSIVFRLILLPSVPIQEIDYYRYLWDGRVLLAGESPYRFAPEQVDHWNWGQTNQEDRHYLWQQSQQSPTVETIFERVHHRQVPTVYPPAAQAVFAAAAFVTPAQAPLWIHVLILKCFLLVFDLGTLFILINLLHRLGLPRGWCLAYGWCPLVMKEVANSAHLDSIAVFFTVLSIRWLVEICYQAREDQGRPSLFQAMMASAALALGVLAKIYPLVLLPVAGAFLLAWFKRRALVPAGVFAVVLVLGYLPFVFGRDVTDYLEDKFPKNQVAAGLEVGQQKDFGHAHQPWTGLGTFLGMWEMNDFLFMLVHENLRFPQPKEDPWFVVIPRPWRVALHSDLVRIFQSWGLLRPGISPAFLLTQGLMGLLLLALTLRWAWQVYQQPEPLPLLRGVFLTLAWGWLLSAAPNPWYLLWCLPFMLFAGRRTWFLLPGLALLYYLRFWMEYQAGGDPVAVQNARATFDYGLIWLEYLPFFVLLLAEEIFRRHHDTPGETP